jgi:hypothetical protein
MDYYTMPYYHHARDETKSRFPKNTEWIEPASLNWSHRDWKENWKVIRPQLSALVAIPRMDNSIGRGMEYEIYSCQAFDIPVIVYIPGWRNLKRYYRKDGTVSSFTREVDFKRGKLFMDFEIVRLPGYSWAYWAEVRV